MSTMHTIDCATAVAQGAPTVNTTSVPANTPRHRCLIRVATLPSKVKVTNP